MTGVNTAATSLDTVVLVAALALPLIGLVPALLALDLRFVARWSRLGAFAAAMAWVVVVARNRLPEIAAIRPDALAATGCAAAALLAAALRRPPLGVGVALTALTAGLAATTSAQGPVRPAAAAAGVGLAVAVALTGANRPLHPWTLAAGAFGAATVVAGLAALGDSAGWAAPLDPLALAGAPASLAAPAVAAGVVLAAGCAVLAAAAASRPSRALVIVLPAVVVIAIRGLPWLGDRSAGPATAVLLAVLGTAAAFGWRGVELPPAAAVAVWAVVAAAAPVPDLLPAAGLLAAAAVLGSVATGPVATVVAALPGAVAVLHALTTSLADDPGWDAAVLLTLVLATASALVARAGPVPAPGVGTLVDGRGLAPTAGVPEAAALALLVWLTVAPGAWHWVGAPTLDAYEEGAAVTLATGSIVVTATLALLVRRRQAMVTSAVSHLARAVAAGALWPAHDPDADAGPGPAVVGPQLPVSPVAGLVALVARPQDHSQWAAIACIVALAALGLAAAVLVGSAVS
jgi:hypothetical protein